jgi:predicted AlkP superfamily pyrophosphatase or phosphodiesterase
MSRTMLMMTDGMRPDAFQQVSTPNLDRLLASGAHTMAARSVLPPVTIACHTSLFFSATPEQHQVSRIGDVSRVQWNGLIEQIKAASKHSAIFYNWDPLREVSRPLSISASFMANIADRYVDGKFVGDDFIVEHACREIPKNMYDFTFVYFATIDECGHRFGWMSDEYLRQIEIVDGYVGDVLAVTPEDTTVLVQSDHGGHDRGHGLDIAEDMTIPWIICGPNIKKKHLIQSSVTLLDTAPTLAYAMGIKPVVDWEGNCVDEVFVK